MTTHTKPPANPQGKGTSPVLATLESPRAELASVPPKQIDQVTAELFTSLFVLDSEFRFKPVVGKCYFLYRKQGRFWLGLTPPDMLGETIAGRFIARCTLQRDLTWTMALDDAVATDASFIDYLGERRAALEAQMAEADTLDDVLPHYERRLSFYRRASAFAMAYSLGRSMAHSGIAGLTYEQALGRLAHDKAGNE